MQYWMPLFLPLSSSKLDTDAPLFSPKIQYLPLLNIPLLIIMRVGAKKWIERISNVFGLMSASAFHPRTLVPTLWSGCLPFFVIYDAIFKRV